MSVVGTSVRYFCGDEERRNRLQTAIDAYGSLNGIDFLEVLDGELEGTPIEDRRQRVLLVQCFSDHLLDSVTVDNVRIDGGVRISPVRVRYVHRLTDIEAAGPEAIPSDERTFLTTYRVGEFDRDRVLVVGTDERGDYSQYRLSLTDPDTDPAPPLADFDPRLYAVEFSFKVECANDLDCRQDTACPPTVYDDPVIDYLARDYHSFRQLMLDRLSVVAPEWKERSPADLGVALVELLAYTGDQLSYLQDSVATESYLGTARRRISVRRHARLVDYFVNEGSNARAWVVLTVGPAADGVELPAGTGLLTRVPGQGTVVASDDVEDAVTKGALCFETLHPITLHAGHDPIELHTWSDAQCCLPLGATSATLRLGATGIAVGDFLLFEEVLGPVTGAAADADPEHRHVVRVIETRTGVDPIERDDHDDPIEVVDVFWHPADKLPFPLCISTKEAGGAPVSVARRNIVLADHGRTIDGEELDEVPEDSRHFRPLLQHGPLTHAYPIAADALPEGGIEIGMPTGAIAPASEVIAPAESGSPEPLVWLTADGEDWDAQRDLLSSDDFRAEFVAEIENDGRARLRFGDGTSGRAPTSKTSFVARYRVGNGADGNVGHESIAHIVGTDGILEVRNPLAAVGGTEPESLDEVRQYAPQAFRVQERAVTASDYADAALRFRRRSAGPSGSEVQHATASFRWTGSWHTAHVTVDRTDGEPVDDAFAAQMRAHLGRFRMAGVDLEIEEPRHVPLDIKLRVCVSSGHSRSDVEKGLMEAFATHVRADGSTGFFHPDNWTFEQSVYLSRIYEAAVAVPGVDSVVVERLQRYERGESGELDAGVLPIERSEIARLDNDPSLRENGVLEIELEGGR